MTCTTPDALIDLIRGLGLLKPRHLDRHACLGLQHAFERGLVHRDVKPQNLLLSRAGVVKVADLGVARLLTDAAGRGQPLTPEGTLLGMPDYVAPEQALDPRCADVRSDLDSLGATLYFLLAGRPPFPDGTLIEKLRRLQREGPVPLERLRPGVPHDLVRVVDVLLSKRPEDRYTTPAEVARALAPAGAGLATLWPSV